MDEKPQVEVIPGLRDRYILQRKRYKEITPYMERMEYSHTTGD